MKLIDNKVDDYYKTKRKKNFLNMLKKNIKILLNIQCYL